VSAPGVADQSLPGPEFISGMDTGFTRCQRLVFPASTPDISAIPEFSVDTGFSGNTKEKLYEPDFILASTAEKTAVGAGKNDPFTYAGKRNAVCAKTIFPASTEEKNAVDTGKMVWCQQGIFHSLRPEKNSQRL